MKIVRLAIFLTGITGLAMGGVMAISSLKTNQEEALVRTHENLKSQATLFVDQFYSVIESAKTISSNSGSGTAPSYVTDRAVIKIKEGVPTEFESFVQVNPVDSSLTPQIDFSLQERVMSAIKNNLSLNDLAISKIAYGTFSFSDLGNKEGIFVATPIYQATNGGVSNPNLIEAVSVILIDPVKAMSSFQKLSQGDEDAYLFNKNGKVLAHTLSAYVGTDLKKIFSLKDSIENLFLGAQTGSVGKYTNIEGNKQVIAIVRVGILPFAVAVEQRAKPPVLSSAWISEELDSGAARKNLGVGLMMIAISLLAFSAITIFATRELNKQIEANVGKRKENEAAPTTSVFAPSNYASKIAPSQLANSLPPQFNPEAKLPADVARSTDEFVELRAQLMEAKADVLNQVSSGSMKRDHVSDFLERMKKCYSAEAIEQELTQVTCELSDSPVLFFRYHKRIQCLTLTSTAGDVKIPNYSEMQAYVRKDIELQVEQLAEEGKVASITNYGPMSKLIISQLNVAHFEAWGVTSSPEISGQSKLVGVLVILQAGIRSAQARPAIAKALKESGNYLYAASNKLKPKSAVYEKSDASHTLDTMNF